MLSTAAVGILVATMQVVGTPLEAAPWASSEPVGAEAVTWAGPEATGLAALDADDRALAERGARALEGVPYAASLTASDLVWVERTLESMGLRERVAQLVMPYIAGGRPATGTAAHRRARSLASSDGVGGFIVGVGPSQETARWLNELQSVAGVPLLMSADLEWGPGTRLRGATMLPINMAIAAAGSADLAFGAGRITGLEARAAGVHVAFAPVADVNVNPLNPVINTRAYGSDPTLVAERVAAFVEGARSAGLLTVAKHFPGHGDTEVDSHLALPVLAAGRARLDEVELTPFRAAIAAGVGGVMTAHMAVPALDPMNRLRPATLSGPILTELLRRELGFSGLVVTDALHMDGIKGQGRPGEVAVAAVLAGADILLQPPNTAEVIDGVVQAVLAGRIPAERIEQSARRVLAAKAAAGLHGGAGVDVGSLGQRLRPAPHETWATEVAERSITLVRADAARVPMEARGRSVVAVIYDDRAGHRWGRDFVAVLEGAGARVQTIRISRSSPAAELARARRAAGSADHAVFASFSRALPWKGGLGLPAPIASLARDLAAGGAAVVSFGDPYLLRQLPDARTYMLAWSEAEVSQRAAARALLGDIRVTGRLPIDLPPYYVVGHGVTVPQLPGVPAAATP